MGPIEEQKCVLEASTRWASRYQDNINPRWKAKQRRETPSSGEIYNRISLTDRLHAA